MAKFKDAIGQEWRIEFDGFLLDRIEKEAKVDLADLSAGGLLAVEKDAKALIRVLAVACDDQLVEQRKPVAKFQKQIRKDAITRARAAVMEALADFFPESEWSAIRSNLTKRKNQPEMTSDQIQLAMGFLKMDPETQRDVMELIKQEEEAVGSSPSSQDGQSVAGPEDTQEMPVYDSQENVESAPADTPSGSSG